MLWGETVSTCWATFLVRERGPRSPSIHSPLSSPQRELHLEAPYVDIEVDWNPWNPKSFTWSYNQHHQIANLNSSLMNLFQHLSTPHGVSIWSLSPSRRFCRALRIDPGPLRRVFQLQSDFFGQGPTTLGHFEVSSCLPGIPADPTSNRGSLQETGAHRT